MIVKLIMKIISFVCILVILYGVSIGITKTKEDLNKGRSCLNLLGCYYEEDYDYGSTAAVKHGLFVTFFIDFVPVITLFGAIVIDECIKIEKEDKK